MDALPSEIPQLTVETENVRRSSVPRGVELEKQEINEAPRTGSSNLEQTSISPSLESVHSDAKIDPESKKLDPEFGSMETIPLEISIQEGISEVKSENSNITLNSSLQCEATGGNDLSKYFNVDSSHQENNDVAGLHFFDTLAENTSKIEDKDLFYSVNQNAVSENQQIETLQDGDKSVGTGTTSNLIDDLSENIKKTEDPPPILLKFFSEDKSGQDKDGKAFFDKISEEKLTSDFSALKLDEPILEVPDTENFLNSPTTNNEIEEAWIPSDRTRQILMSIITSNMPFSPEKNDLTMPGVIIEEEMEDPVKALLIECNSPFAMQRKVLSADDVSEDETGLKKLMEDKCYHAAINLTKRLLKNCGQGPGSDGKPSNHTPLSLRLWYTRLALFIKLRKFSLAEVESAAFGDLDKSDLYYEFYPAIYKGKKGTMVPFALRLLLAELPQYQGNHQTALDNMYHILNIIQKMISNIQNDCAEDGTMIELSDARKSASLEIWKKRERRVLFSILNCVLAQKDYILAVSIAKILIKKSGTHTAHLHSALGRIYLQLGDVQHAENYFKRASVIAEEISEDFKVEENINNALLSVAFDENEKAFMYFNQANALKPSAMLVNNMAVCKLYTGQLKESLKLLESAIHASPSSCLHDGLLFNVCTLYELESSRCPQKKLAMLELVSKCAGDAFNVNCLKIQTVKT